MKATASQAVFDLVAKSCLIYGSCWEDPALDRQALDIGPDDTMLVITSAGCNVLDYALCGPKHIHAVDANPRQNALLELRMAGIRHLSYDDFFRIFGEGAHPGFDDLYRRLRKDLSAFARSYWDRRTGWFTGRGWRKSFYLHPLTGWISLLCNAVTAHYRDEIESLIAAESVEAQREIWVRRICPLLWTPQFRWVVSQQLFMTAMGVPVSQARELSGGNWSSPADYILSCMDRVIGHLPMRTNYFWQLYMRNGSYSRTCCPEYLKEDQFHLLKGGLVDRIDTHTATVEGFLQENDVVLTKYVLLDHMDWMDDRTIGREWEQTIRRAGPKARAIFRTVRDPATMLRGVPLGPSSRRTAGPLLDRLAFDRRRAEDLHRADRVGTYNAFFIADFEGEAA